MSLANNKRSQVVAWLGCQDAWDEIEHAPHSHTDRSELVQCAGYTEEGTGTASEALVKSPTVWMTGSGRYMLTDLSEGHLERLRDALDLVSLEDSEGVELQHALYDI